MPHEYTWLSTQPINRQKAGLGALRERETRAMIEERLAVDHNMGGVLADGATQDGTHKQVTLAAKSATPSTISGAGRVYSKTHSVDGVDYVDLCYLDGNGDEVFITEKGDLALFTPQRLSVEDSSSVTLSGSYGSDIVFTTENDKYPSELVFTDDSIFTCAYTGFYYIGVKFLSNDAISIGLYKNGVVEIEWSIVAREGANNQFAILWVEEDDTISIKGKSMTISNATITDRSLEISRV